MFYKVQIKAKGKLVNLPKAKTVRSPAVLFFKEEEFTTFSKLMKIQILEYTSEQISQDEYEKHINEEKAQSKPKRKKRIGSASLNMSFTIKK